MKKIALIFNCHNNSNDQLTKLGLIQAGYLIQLALGWFNETIKLNILNKVVVFSTERANDLEPAMLLQNCTDMNYVLPLQMIDRRWGSYGDDLTDGGSKAENLAIQIDEFNRDYAVVFAWFSDDYNVMPFLNHWDIPKPNEWPTDSAPVLVCIDIETKSIGFAFAPFAIPD
ncbi:MAG: hypothetical protein WCP93_02970 [Candidatus Berkelbacteria bacterium]